VSGQHFFLYRAIGSEPLPVRPAGSFSLRCQPEKPVMLDSRHVVLVGRHIAGIQFSNSIDKGGE